MIMKNTKTLKYSKLAALATLAIGSATAGAQTTSAIKFYGSIDLGAAYSTNGSRGGAGTTQIGSGVLRPSLFGLQGLEDLGGGLKAVFQVEAGFDADTGAMKTYSGNPSTATPAAPGGLPVNGLFNRRAYVGLQGAFGSLTLGRDYTPIYWAALDGDALSLTTYGNLQESVLLSGTGTDRYGRASNAIFYASPEIGAWLVRAMYSAGSESGGGAGAPPAAANRMLAASLKYSNGGLVLTGVYQQVALPRVAGTPLAFTGATGKRKDESVAARYNFERWALTTGYLRIQQPTASDTDASAYWLGATAKLGSGKVHANYIRMRQRVATGPAQTGDVFGLAYIYPLSKRTSLYSSYGRLENSANATFALVSADTSVAPGSAGAGIKALALGMQHSF